MHSALWLAILIAQLIIENEIPICKNIVGIDDAVALLDQLWLRLLVANLDAQIINDRFDKLIIGHESKYDHVPNELINVHVFLVIRPIAEDQHNEFVDLPLQFIQLFFAAGHSFRKVRFELVAAELLSLQIICSIKLAESIICLVPHFSYSIIYLVPLNRQRLLFAFHFVVTPQVQGVFALIHFVFDRVCVVCPVSFEIEGTDLLMVDSRLLFLHKINDLLV